MMNPHTDRMATPDVQVFKSHAQVAPLYKKAG
jgi:hypothetical protein